MSSTSQISVAVLVAAVIIWPALGEVPTIRCPQTHQGQPLARAAVFDGPPAQLVELIPLRGGWRLNDGPASPGGYFLVCEYRGIAATVAIRLPTSICACELEPRSNVGCR